jgi:signal transduction histidine kinase
LLPIGLIGYADLTQKKIAALLGPNDSNLGTVSKAQLLDILRQIQGWSSAVLSSSQHMLELLDNVLDLSKFESKKMRLDSKPVNLHGLCEQVRTLLATTIKPGVKLFVDAGNLSARLLRVRVSSTCAYTNCQLVIVRIH